MLLNMHDVQIHVVSPTGSTCASTECANAVPVLSSPGSAPDQAFPGLQAPQLWQGIAEHLAKSSPEVLVLIHPIHMTPSSHSQRAISVGFCVSNLSQCKALYAKR